jgi:sensor histidine kinase YesM
MTGYEFIFSDKPVKRLYRHILFWSILILHFIIQNLIAGGGANEALKSRSIDESAFYGLFFFPIYVISSYIFRKVLLPVYLFRQKYVAFYFWMVIMIAVDCIACSLSGELYLHTVLQIPFDKITFTENRYNIIVNGLFLPTVIFGFTGGVKLAKNWYLEQKENERLAKEKIIKELQLLKSQLHPRFLFHSLHTIKKHINSSPKVAAALILQLSDLLSYILYESDRERVPLEKEIEIIKSYVDLQKKSSKSKLIAEVNISGDIIAKYIPPLLLLSFIENAFDFFLKENGQQPSLILDITVWDIRLNYRLYCNHFSDQQHDILEVKKKFVNIEKQLFFIYGDTQQLDIENTAEGISVFLKLPLYNGIANYKSAEAMQNEIHELL